MRAMKTEHGLLWLTEIQYLESNFSGLKLKTKTYTFHLHFKISLNVEKKNLFTCTSQCKWHLETTADALGCIKGLKMHLLKVF